jgi:hypothetical protein
LAVQHVSGTWSGDWVTERLGLRLTGSAELPELIGLALRENKKRAHLLVSQVLGKHVPQRPALVHGAGVELGRRVRELLGPDDAAQAVVLGYAETATALGHSVADGLGAPYLHSTRRPVAGVAPVGGFEEEHSHATSHLLLPTDPAFLAGDGPLVLVDDEFSTGTTVLNTIRALHARHPRSRYVVVALVDLRTPADRARLTEAATELGARLDLLATATGGVELPADVLDRAARLIAAAPAQTPPDGPSAPVERIALPWPAGLPEGGRHGFSTADADRLDAALPELAAPLAEALAGRSNVLVLGFEELMYAPLRIAGALGELSARTGSGSPPPPARRYWRSTTPATRSGPGWPSPPTTTRPTARGSGTPTTSRPATTPRAASTPWCWWSTSPPTPPPCTRASARCCAN